VVEEPSGRTGEDPGAVSAVVEDRRAYRMPFEWWDDADTRNFRRTQPEMALPEDCFRLLSWKAPDDRSYLLNNTNRRLFTKDGPFEDPYFSADRLYDSRAGEDAFVFCPGPSLAQTDMSRYSQAMSIAVNSAGFAFKSIRPVLWAVFESNYMLEVLRHAGKKNPAGLKVPAIPEGLMFLFSPRVAIRWRGNGYTDKAPGATYWVARFEEDRLMPHRTPSVATMGAIAAAYWLGAKRCFMLGLDVSRPGGKPYVEGIPYGAAGATGPIEEQLKALVQIRYPGMEILNCSPHSREKLMDAMTPSSYREAEEAASL
jgi:hypothetical protein